MLRIVSMYLFAICVYFFEEVLFRLVAKFFTGLFVVLLLNFESSLYILNTSPLSDRCIMRIFSHSVDFDILFLYKPSCIMKPKVIQRKDPVYLGSGPEPVLLFSITGFLKSSAFSQEGLMPLLQHWVLLRHDIIYSFFQVLAGHF